MKRKWIVYTDAELAWIEANREMPRRELHAQFCRTFARTDVSQTNLTALCKRKRWLTGRTGRFVKGQPAHNKGKKMPFHPNNAATRFKPGEMRGRAKERYKPIGTERLSRSGYLERKIHDGLPLQSRWRAVHLIRWEEKNGPLPDGWCLKCLDGNKTNTDPENWEAIPRALLPRLNALWKGVKFDDADPSLKPSILAIAKLEHAARKAKSDRAGGRK